MRASPKVAMMNKNSFKMRSRVEWLLIAVGILFAAALMHSQTHNWGTVAHRLSWILLAWSVVALVILMNVRASARRIRRRIEMQKELPSEEALEYLKTRELAPNRFEDVASAVAFVKELYRLGAMNVRVDGIRKASGIASGVYADTLVVTLPNEPEKRKPIFDLCDKENAEAGFDNDNPTGDKGQRHLEFWWD